MNQELWASVERKMKGFIQATKNMSWKCMKCGTELEPHDTGLDPYTGKRQWITECCGIIERYEEKVFSEHEVLND